MGDRFRQTVGGNTVNYVIDSSSGLSQVLADGTNTYLYGLDRISQSNTGGKDYFLGDASGSVRQMANTSGGIVLSRNYEPYGTIYGAMGSKSSSYGFTSEWTDGTGLVNLRARYYAPTQGRFISQDRWGGIQSQPTTLNKWLYANGNPIIYIDPSGFIAEGQEAKDAQIITSKLITYGISIKVDWGEDRWNYWFNDPVDSSKNGIRTMCSWITGEWSIAELNQIQDAVETLSTAMGGPQNFISNTGGITIDQKDIGDYLGLTSPHNISYTNNSNSFSTWATMHELAHAWDANFNWRLSILLEENTRGWTSKSVADVWKTFGLCDNKPWEKGCNDAGYFFGGNPPKGSDLNFNRVEDFAESVTTYFYPDEAQKSLMIKDTNYLNLYYYSDYTKEPRWQFVQDLFNG